MLGIKNVLINARPHPLGVGQEVNVSWQLKSDQKSTNQVAYQVKVFHMKHQVLDTGRVTSAKNSFITLHPDKKWLSNADYRVIVMAWDNHHNQATNATSFSTSLLSPHDWHAQWRRVDRPYQQRQKGFNHQPPASLFRRIFRLADKTVARARIFATALGAYQITINGHHPDKRKLAPGHTAYRRILDFQDYDVVELLQAGQNIIGMEVGDGWYCNPQTMPPIKGLKPDHAVLFQLMIDYQDGSHELVVSDEATQWQESPVQAADLYAGELYDATKKVAGWNTVAATSGWRSTVATEYPLVNLRPQIKMPVRPVCELKPVKLIHAPNGDQILDFGQVLAGVVRCRINEESGHQVSLEHTEVLDKDGNYFINTKSALGVTEQKDVYIADGQPATFVPDFTYHGFRYVRLKGFSKIDLDDFTAIVLSSTGEDLGSFKCSNQLVNQLYHNILWSQQANFFSIPTDCPQREKAGWTGDVWVYGWTALENANETPLLTEWLENLAADQEENNGIVTFTCPDTSQYHDSGVKMGKQFGCNGIVNSAGWGDVAIHLPITMYNITDNLAIIRRQYTSMRAWGEYIIRQARQRKPGSRLPDKIELHLWNTGFQYGEWLIPSEATDSQDFKQIIANMAHSACYTAPIIGWLSMVELAKAAQLLHKTGDQVKYQTEADLMKYAIQHGGVIDADGNMPSDLMGAYVMPIVFELVPAQFKDKFASRLCTILRKNNYRLDTGFLGTPFLLDALCRIGRRDLAYRVLLQEQTPGWVAEVKRGATTIWESWISYDKDGNPLPTSFNHYANGCVANWMFKDIGGLDQEKTDHGFTQLVFQPHVGYGITNAQRTYVTSQGTAKCDWRVRDGHFDIQIEVPANSRARVMLPNGQQHYVGSGHYHFGCQVK